MTTVDPRISLCVCGKRVLVRDGKRVRHRDKNDSRWCAGSGVSV